MESVHTALVGGGFTSLDYRGVNFDSRFVDDFLDAPRMDAAVGNELLERETRDLPAHWIEARNDDGIRGIVDDYIDSRCELECADVPALASDDAALHLVVRQRDRGYRRLYALLRRNPLDRQGDDLLRLALGVALR